jgi:hypothetical protein
MAEQFLEPHDRDAGLGRVHSEGVPRIVRGCASDLREPADSLPGPPDSPVALEQPREDQIIRTGRNARHVPRQHPLERRSDRKIPDRLPRFYPPGALVNQDPLGVEKDVTSAEALGLTQPGSGVEERTEEGPPLWRALRREAA